MASDIWNTLSAAGTVASAVVAAIALLLVYFQLRATRRIAEADLILRLEAEWVDHFSGIYKRFLPGGEWNDDRPGPQTQEERVALENYLDFFATLSSLVDKELLSLSLIDEMFAYRYFIATRNKHTQELVGSNKVFWSSLIRLDSQWQLYRNGKNAPTINHHAGLGG